MGFDIRVATFENGHMEVQTNVYMSYNWADLSNIWHVRHHMHDLPSSEVQANLEAALKKLDELGVKTKTFTTEENSSWGWGVNMTPEDRMGVFRYHMERFLAVAKENPTAYFLDEETDEITIDGVTYRLRGDHSDDE